ncbi:hypothetical protein BSKO_06432 [Bryopsis sp. KO-2023]|nr:hypothetical protein BSKO_06432 [Bryopsis sp. KO-2023]
MMERSVSQPLFGTDKTRPPLAKRFRKYWFSAKRYAISRYGFCLLLALGALYVLSGVSLERIYISCSPGQPLVRVYHSFLPENVFRSISDVLPTHPLITQNQLDGDNFQNTTGWLVKFNRDGLEKLRTIPAYAMLLPYIDATIRPEANAFVFNLLVCHQPSEWHAGMEAVGTHLDDTIALSSVGEWYWGETFLAHQVNVLYTNLPEGIEGGEVEVWPFESENSETGKAVVTPAENAMVEFRGDAYHRVRAFRSPSGKPRLSLVFEQYKIHPWLYPRTIPFCENTQCDMLEAGVDE